MAASVGGGGEGPARLLHHILQTRRKKRGIMINVQYKPPFQILNIQQYTLLHDLSSFISYRDPGGQAVQQARLRGTHSPCPSFIDFFAPTSLNMSLNIFNNITQFWTLKESGAPCSVGQGQNFLLFTVEKSCETNPLLQRAVLQILRHSLFNRISTNWII